MMNENQPRYGADLRLPRHAEERPAAPLVPKAVIACAVGHCENLRHLFSAPYNSAEAGIDKVVCRSSVFNTARIAAQVTAETDGRNVNRTINCN